MTAIDGDGDGCVGVFPVSPMHGAVGVPQGKAQAGGAVEVDPVYGELPRIGDGCGGHGRPKQKKGEKRQEKPRGELVRCCIHDNKKEQKTGR